MCKPVLLSNQSMTNEPKTISHRRPITSSASPRIPLPFAVSTYGVSYYRCALRAASPRRLLLIGKMGGAFTSVRSGTRELEELKKLGMSPPELPSHAPLPILLRHPVTRRGLGFAEASAVSAFFAPYWMSTDEARARVLPLLLARHRFWE